MLKRLFRKNELVLDTIEPVMNAPIETKEGILFFENFNFKLAILQILMYDLNVLDTQFDLYDFVDEYTQRPIYLQEESYDVIPEVIEYFENYDIDIDYAQYITEISMDPMHDIYTNIFPFWDGMDDLFDVNSVSAFELGQFTNLKSAKFMGCVEEAILPPMLTLETI